MGAFGNQPVDKDDCPPPSLNSVPDGPGPDQFSIVHAIRVSKDGVVYVADRENRRGQTFSLDGKFIRQLVRGSAPFAPDLALSRDPDQEFLFVGGDTDIVVVNRKTMEIATTIEGNRVIGGGHQLRGPGKVTGAYGRPSLDGGTSPFKRRKAPIMPYISLSWLMFQFSSPSLDMSHLAHLILAAPAASVMFAYISENSG